METYKLKILMFLREMKASAERIIEKGDSNRPNLDYCIEKVAYINSLIDYIEQNESTKTVKIDM